MSQNELQEATRIHQQQAMVPQSEMTPMGMIASVVQQGADPAALERVTAWAERMQANEARRAYAQAMTNFKAICPTVQRTGKGHTNTYATLVSIDEQIRPALSQCQLSPSWRVLRNDKDWIEVECRVTHVMGHYESTSLGGPPDRGPARNELQARASTVAYLERYTLKALLGLVDKDMKDDDGAGGAASAEKPKAQQAVEATREDKKKFYDACVKASRIAKPTGQQCVTWLSQVQALAGIQGVADCAAWLKDNGVIVDGVVCERAEPVTDFDADLPSAVEKPWVCQKCGTLYVVQPARGLCIAEDSDGFTCKGKIVERTE
jgi:hypothetical protein